MNFEMYQDVNHVVPFPSDPQLLTAPVRPRIFIVDTRR